jgi:hypothetical protein
MARFFHWQQICISGLALVSSLTIALMTASIQSCPDIQLFGENFHDSMTCACRVGSHVNTMEIESARHCDFCCIED